MAEGIGPLSIDPAVLALQVVAFAILYLLLRRFLFGPLLSVMGEREKEIAEGMEAGKRAKAELGRIDEEKERMLAEAREEGRLQVREAVREAEDAREDIIKEARSEAEEIRDRARRAVDLEREETMIELRRQVVDLALLAASRAVLGRLDEEKHRQVVDDFIQELESQ
jgi:F-type H+-transporting ATPase subunit b